MKPLLFEGHDIVLGAPDGWDASKHGECSGLPIMRDQGACISMWELTVEERAAIAAGANVILSVYSGNTQPAVWLAAGRAPRAYTEHFPIIIAGGGTTIGTQVVDAQTNRFIKNVKRLALSADADTGHLHAWLEIIGEQVELGGGELPVPPGLRCLASVVAKAEG